jgi:hypothetical protein
MSEWDCVYLILFGFLLVCIYEECYLYMKLTICQLCHTFLLISKTRKDRRNIILRLLKFLRSLKDLGIYKNHERIDRRESKNAVQALC